MELQKTFGKNYAEKLRNDIDSNMDCYMSDDFNVDESQILYVPNLEHPTGILEKMLDAVEDDGRAAKILYEAYKGLTPIQASQQAFWIYLAHTELYAYVKKRWPDIEGKRQYVLDHWFFTKGLIYQALSSLWWHVYLSVDDNAPEDEKYKYTDFLFSNYTLRAVRLGPTRIMRHKEAVIGIIKYLMSTVGAPDSSNSMESRVNFAVSHINKIGGTKQLAALDRDFFYNELNKVRKELLSYQHKNNK